MNSIALPVVLHLFAELFSSQSLKAWNRSPSPLVKQPRGFYRRIYGLGVTLWYMVFQRLNVDKTQDAVVKDLRAGGADRLSPSRRQPLSKKVRSHATASYNEARQRLPVEFLRWALAQIAAYVQKAFRLVELNSRTFQLLDGSTLPILFQWAVAKDYPAAGNQHGSSDWCLMRVVVGFCAVTGVALSAAEGSQLLSEQALSWTLMAQALAGTVWIADRNFGVWSVVAQALYCRQDVIVRLTRARANRLAGRRPWISGQDEILSWRRTKHDRIAPGTAEVLVEVRLMYVRVRREGRYVDLWLCTTLLDREAFPVSRVLELYGWRWEVEVDFRYLKTALDMQVLAVHSASMARKEFYAGLIAYNLVRVVMATAEQPKGGHPASGLSFSQVRRVLVHWLADWGKDWRSRRGSLPEKFQRLIAQAAEQLLPTRSQLRPSEPRCIRRRPAIFPLLRGPRQMARRKMLSPK
jgi:hypothetical protein